MENYKLVYISNYWTNKPNIPAILTKVDGILPNRSDVWIPSGYDSSGGYSTRKIEEIYEFSGNDDMKNDITRQWKEESERCGASI